ncbi:oxalurate catabolism protein HpxZ [Pseudoroseomonas cervicalis]|nr:oxalurate catabolism protein HpxZ [Pseudoroseomonas cervicalis]
MTHEIDNPEALAELREAFLRYDLALEQNDVAVLDDSFWEDARTLRYGVGENLYGHAEIAAFRAGRQPAELARRARRLERTVLHTFGRDFGVANTEYVLLADGRRGRQSQSWVRFPEGWKVVAAHVSLMAPG